MTDRISVERRSANMSAIRGRDTAPEIRVRRIAHNLGYRFVLHAKQLPGRPDIVFTRRKKVVFVHGCFWHRHRNCRFAYMPKSRVEFWTEKFAANVRRDKRVMEELTERGWDAMVVWECECDDPRTVEESLSRFLGARSWRARGSRQTRGVRKRNG